MQESETRRFLEEQFDKYERSRPEQTAPFVSELTEEEAPADEFLQAPASFGKEWGEMFMTLPPEMRRYLHYREHEIAKAFARLEEELREKRFLDEEFSSKGCRHGFKSARDWIEKLIFAEEMLEASPRDTLCYLAKAYGLEPDFIGKPDKADACERKIGLLCEELQRLRERFDERERYYAAAAAAARAAKKAKAAGFSPRGRAAAAEDEQELTTRQILERKFAELED